jgi:hypothetical protein
LRLVKNKISFALEILLKKDKGIITAYFICLALLMNIVNRNEAIKQSPFRISSERAFD